MIFDIISATVSVNKWGNHEGTRGLSFEVVPEGREYLEIGDKYVLSSGGYHRMLHRDRERLTAKVHVSADRSYIEHGEKEPTKEVVGWATFYPERQGAIDYSPPALEIVVVVDADQFDELFKLRLAAPGAATMQIGFDGMEYGWEPDGSHKIWKLEEEQNGGSRERKPVTSFWLNVRTFTTTEGTISAERERQQNAELAESPDPEERKLAAASAPNEDATTKLLRECRIILLALLVLAVIAAFRR